MIGVISEDDLPLQVYSSFAGSNAGKEDKLLSRSSEMEGGAGGAVNGESSGGVKEAVSVPSSLGVIERLFKSTEATFTQFSALQLVQGVLRREQRHLTHFAL